MKHIAILLLLCISSLCVSAQVDPRARYEEFKAQAKRSYEDFRARANKQYSDFLKKVWKEYNVLPAIERPKDEEVPPVIFNEEEHNKKQQEKKQQEQNQGQKDNNEQKDNKKQKDNKAQEGNEGQEENKKKKIAVRHNGKQDEQVKDDDGEEIKFDSIIAPPKPAPQPTPIAPIKETPQDEKTVTFTFYGTKCEVRLSDKLKLSLGNCSKDKLSDAWNHLSSDDITNNTIRDCLELRIRLELSDWAYLNMLHTLAVQALGDTNEATLLMAYIYCQSGYKLRLAMANNRLYMLFASKHSIYGLGAFVVGGETYYQFNCKANRMEICDAEFPNETPLSLLMSSRINFDYDGSAPRKLTSKRYPEVSVNVQVNKNLIDFYNTYPTSALDGNFMTRWAMYANTPMEKEVEENLYPALRNIISGKSQKEAVERLLNWVQTAFVYEYDDKVWGYDRAFFAEESLYYPYCDCEDRSILFTRIVRDLLGLDCILIYYPGHLASAVCFDEQVSGDYILLNGRRFTVCDGTYIGASVGMTMPGMDNKAANVILLDTKK